MKMLEYEDHCVGCPPEIGCLGTSCPNINVPTYYCDDCKNYAQYNIDGDDLCENCAEKYLKERFNDLSIEEMAKALEINMTHID